MSITSNQLVFRKSLEVSDAGGNGGAMSFDEVVSGVKNNLWSDIYESERVSGSTKYRKMFMHVNNSEANGEDIGLDLVAPRVFVETRTPGDDIITIFPATQTDQQSAVSGAEDLYGMGILTNTVSPGGTQLTVTVEDWASAVIFRTGDLIRISDKSSINDAGNNEEYHTITGTPSANGNEITINLVGTLANGYTSGSATKVSSVIEASDVQCTVASFSNNSGAGTFSADGIATDQTGTAYDTWTLLFSTSSNYVITGAVAGAVGGGDTGSDFAPSNPNSGSGNYFRIISTEFGGTFTVGDTITFTTTPSAVPLWVRRDVPAGATTLTANSAIIAVDGESA